MFRPDRIGTPAIHTQAISISTATTALGSATFAGSIGGNVMNATALGKFDKVETRWDNATAKSLAVGHRVMIAANVSVADPLAGDTVGVEYNLGLIAPLPSCLVVPGIIKPTGFTATVWSTFVTGNAAFTPLTDYAQMEPAEAGMTFYGARGQVLLRDTVAGTPAGNYAFGFLIYNPTAAAVTWSHQEFFCSIRQDMDQPGVGYSDTRR